MGNLDEIKEYNKYQVLSDKDSEKLRIVCRILAVICNIPCFLSIFVFLFQYSPLKSSQKIQLRLCIAIVLYESSHYLPVSTKYQGLCYFQFIISSGIHIIISYLTMIYSYIALILFTKPNIIKFIFNIFFIHFSPYLLFIGIILYILKVPKLCLFFKFTVYPDDEDPSRILIYILVLVFLIINILNNILLIIKIKRFIKGLSTVDNYAKEKLHIFKKKLIWNIIAIIFVFYYNLPFGILIYFKIVSGNIFFNFGHMLFVYINKAILGIVFWFIYIYNINFWHKFLILIKIEKKEKFEKKFQEEEKILDYSVDESMRNNETLYISMNGLENMHSINDRISLKSKFEDEQL